MSLYESGDSSGEVSLGSLFLKEKISVMTGDISLSELISYILRGGWPQNVTLPFDLARLTPGQYIEAILSDDLTRVDGVKRDVQKVRLLLRSLARNESTVVSNRTLLKDIREYEDSSLNIETVADYLNLFDKLFLTDNQKPFSPRVRSSVRLKQSEKRHLSDPSLACALLGVTRESLLNDLETLGFLFEALCERDLAIYAEAHEAKLFHYQDYSGNEIDAAVEMPDGRWGAIEIKLGAHKIDEAAENLLAIDEAFRKDPKGVPPSMLCVICGLTHAAYQRPDGVYVIPITALKD